MIKVLISTRSQLQIEDDVQIQINQYASVNQLFDEYKRQVNVSEFDHDSSLQFKNIGFEEVVMVWQKEPLKILEKGKRLREIGRVERLDIIVYLPSSAEPIIICQMSNYTCIIWDYRNMKPLVNTLEGDPVMKKVVNGQVLKVVIDNKPYLWNDVKNKTMRSLMEGKLGTLIRMKLETDPKLGKIEEAKVQNPLQARSFRQKEGQIISKNHKSINEKEELSSQGQEQIARQNKKEQVKIIESLKEKPSSKGHEQIVINQEKKKKQIEINYSKKEEHNSQGQEQMGVDMRKEKILPKAEQPNIEQIVKENAEHILQEKKGQGVTPVNVLPPKKVDPIQQVIKLQQKEQGNANIAGPDPSLKSDLTLQICFQATYSNSSGKRSISLLVSKNQSLSDLLPSIILQLKQNGFDWSDDSFDPIRDKKKISITYNKSEFHKITKPFKSLVNTAATKQIIFNITRHYEGG